jgi:transcriptional regulator with XRE-family HTH domain
MVLLMKDRKQRQFIREWREFRGLSQERLADRMGITRGYVSQVERGVRRYDQYFLEAAADALSCEPADLIMRDPTQAAALWSIWDQIPPTQREQAVRVLETFAAKKTGTDS